MGVRVQLTGIGESGPVWIWVAHITSVFTSHDQRAITCMTVIGGRDPIAVQETPEQVLDLIDAAAAGVLA